MHLCMNFMEKEQLKTKQDMRKVLKGFEQAFGDSKEVLLFSSPGRTEISGNHTDHNHGKVLAGSINLDCVGSSCKELFQPCADHQRNL